jgi:hypothetical protein
MAGPLDEFVARVNRMVATFMQQQELDAVEVRIELVDGTPYLVASASAEPGFGFFSFLPHRAEGEEPRQVIVPIGAVRSIEISARDPERPFGFTPTESSS